MSISIFFLVLTAALLHASWNIIVKGGSNKLFETGINALGACLGATFLLPFITLPPEDCLLYLLLSCLFHFIYYFCVAATYRFSDLSLGYTLMRGTAPLLTALVLSFAGQPLTVSGWGGVLLLCSGIFVLAFQQNHVQHRQWKGIAFALCTAVIIMCYTLADGLGARASGDAINYAAWLFLINLFPLNIYLLAKYGAQYGRYLKARVKTGLFGGFCSLFSYGIVIYAMTKAPIAMVEALRETSVIFGMIMAVLFLGEKLGKYRIAAVLLVFAGAVMLRI